jgi:hypothetical protein
LTTLGCERSLVVDRVAGGRQARPSLLEQARHLQDQLRGNERLVALDVDHDIFVLEAQQRRGFGDAIGAGSVVGARHQRRVAVRAHRRADALVVGRHVHRGRAALRRLLAHAHHHRPAGEVGERLAGKTTRAEARRDDDVELHPKSSSAGSSRASSSSIPGMPSFTG